MSKSKIIIHYQDCLCCTSTETNASIFRKLSEVIFNVMFKHKFLTRSFLQKSTAYKRNNLFYDKGHTLVRPYPSILSLLFKTVLSSFLLLNLIKVEFVSLTKQWISSILETRLLTSKLNICLISEVHYASLQISGKKSI